MTAGSLSMAEHPLVLRRARDRLRQRPEGARRPGARLLRPGSNGARGHKRRLGKSEQRNEWIAGLTAARMAAAQEA